jgi:cation diffusion facilitator CzcD-associated flavoprotein CzcO
MAFDRDDGRFGDGQGGRIEVDNAFPRPGVVIVGAGFGGIAAAIELRRHGFRDVTILERAPDLGGTWYYNTYPAVACDVPSHLYSFSFDQRRHWSRICSPQDEILGYLREVAREQGVEDEILDKALDYRAMAKPPKG